MTDDGGPADSGQPIPPARQSGDPVEVSAEPSARLSADQVRELYSDHGRDLLSFLTGVLRDLDAAQDVCQATFQRLIESGHDARAETIRGWLFKVAFHEAMAYRRQQSRRDQWLQQKQTNQNGEPPEPDGPLISPLNLLVRAEEIAKLKELLQELPAEQQFVVRQRIHEEKTFAAIAAELQVPLGTVLTRMRLAIQKLRVWFE